ncbi:hypothetical protein SCLCIDRAFT_1208366 [Scleroderma citrinum Foug A]|uniref:Uncharacterized protein n=1 Tax=Scleroderma citrinum Foug A TaxID=1036808 RepID=A0A0C3ENP7_9AGAM|nr:hypothetical protein SCLCIDRAFT_1208366 [Scleroderma citrinum Foug A]
MGFRRISTTRLYDSDGASRKSPVGPGSNVGNTVLNGADSHLIHARGPFSGRQTQHDGGRHTRQ